MNYHVGRAGQQLGVFSLDDIRAKLASGEFRSDDLGWTEGMTDWRPLGEIVPGVTPTFIAPPPIRADSPRNWAPPAPFAAPHRPLGPKPANHLVGAILATLFCCLPFGIVAIVYASQVDGKYAVGDEAGALDASAKAKKWMWIGFWVGILPMVLWFGLMASGFVAGFTEAMQNR